MSGPEYGRLIGRLRPEDEESVYITIISVEEQTRGWLSFIARAKSIERQIKSYARLHTLLRDLRNRKVLDFNRSAAERFHELSRSRLRVGTMDLKIAAIALVNDAILLPAICPIKPLLVVAARRDCNARHRATRLSPSCRRSRFLDRICPARPEKSHTLVGRPPVRPPATPVCRRGGAWRRHPFPGTARGLVDAAPICTFQVFLNF
jgi:tRNA(fMet)-specific endonuclease VapC